MKKLILTTLNSKYIHTSLALRCLRESITEEVDINIREYNINDHYHDILENLYLEKGDFYGFSCYIWNIEVTIKIVNSLKTLLPNSVIILGGPEVSYDTSEYLRKSTGDIIVIGEGENTLNEVLKKLNTFQHLGDTRGIAFRDGENIIENPMIQSPIVLDDLPFPYKDWELEVLGEQIIYYESSRGCPFKCSYCLSSIDREVRFLSMDRVKYELSLFMSQRIKQVKFVDRTFNCNQKRAREILDFIIDNHNGYTNFHFEIAGDILNDDIIRLLQKAPIGAIQLEIGVQSTNLDTLTEINRKSDINKIKTNVKKLLRNNNIHIHLDLIAGLPYEDLDSFILSFNEVYKMNPHMLQLGFLKLLKGSQLVDIKEKHGYIFNQYPPFEVFSNKYITYDSIIYLKQIAILIEKYYNTGGFFNTISYIIDTYYIEPFDFYNDFHKYWDSNSLFHQSHSKKRLYHVLFEFLSTYNDDIITELLKLDYLMQNKWPVPDFLAPKGLPKEAVFQLLKNSELVNFALPQYEQLSPKEIFKRIHVEIFAHILNDGNQQEVQVIFYKSHENNIDKQNDYYII